MRCGLLFAGALALALLALPSVSQSQSLPGVNPTLYYDVRSHSFGAVVLTKVGSVPKLGLNLDAIAGVTAPTAFWSTSAQLTDFAGVAGFGVSKAWTISSSIWYVQVGLGVTWRVGEQLGAGPYGTVGFRF